jgi:L-ascorbate metabolism protein UlaG (beta-lactamase superfamily)
MKSLIFIITAIFSVSAFSHPFPKSDHYNGKKFFNPEGPELKSFWNVIKWQLTNDKRDWPQSVPNENYGLRPLAPNERASATFINHSTFLLQLPGLNIMTDPVYSERVSPVTFAGPKRVRAPGIPLDILPSIDVVIISHNHYDHLDLETIKQLDKRSHPLFLVPLGDGKLLKAAGVLNVKEVDWWEEVKVKDTRIVFTPSQHWSARGLFDKNDSLWGAYMIMNEATKIYFGGDTGYGPHFLDTKSRLGAPDLALIPIGAYQPEWFMLAHHMNPAQAVKAHFDLESARSIGIHFGTFQLADEAIDDPTNDLSIAKKTHGLSDEAFRVLDQGQTLSF